MPQPKTCFVIIGYDIKTDFSSGQQYNMESTFSNLIKPVFVKLGIECFRAKDKKHSGVIDVMMYQWIFEADIVVADLTTLNPNVLYELGVRHAVKKHSTILIADEKLKTNKAPFDLNHVSIAYYKHLGDDIGVGEAIRFSSELEKLALAIINKEQVDSPLYTFLPDITPPGRTSAVKFQQSQTGDKADFAEIIKQAEVAKNKKDFNTALSLFNQALKESPRDAYLIQRKALVTYQADPKSKKALKEAEDILKTLDPDSTTDPETLGLSGAIKKRMYDIDKEKIYLDESMKFYARGFYVKQDYYNGINFAFLLTLKASITDDKIECTGYFAHSNQVRQQVISICKSLTSRNDFEDRKDKNWIYLTMAEAHLGLGNESEIDKLMSIINQYSEGSFDQSTFNQQTEKLKELIELVKNKIR